MSKIDISFWKCDFNAYICASWSLWYDKVIMIITCFYSPMKAIYPLKFFNWIKCDKKERVHLQNFVLLGHPSLNIYLLTLACLVGARSWKLWEILAKLEITGSSSQWSRLNDYNSAQQFAMGLNLYTLGHYKSPKPFNALFCHYNLHHHLFVTLNVPWIPSF